MNALIAEQQDPQHGIVFDLETVRHPELRTWLETDEKIARLEGCDLLQLHQVAEANEIKLGNRTQYASVHKKIKDHFEDQVNKAALSVCGAQITTIACREIAGVLEDLESYRAGEDYMSDDWPGMVWTATEEHSEYFVIEAFLEHLESYGDPVVLMGFNIRGSGGPGQKGFDIPILRARAAVLGTRWPHWLPPNLREDRYSKNLFDVRDVLFEGTLDSWLRMTGLPIKTASGAAVQDMTPQERGDYCANDVELERMLCGLTLWQQPARLSNLLHRREST